MTDDALARAEANFTAAKDLCRTGHAECSYGGMSAANGYWLAVDECEMNHGEVCDLRAVCDGAPAETGFIGSEPDDEIWYWVWRVCACRACADLYAAAHPEWKRPDPDAPKPSHDEIMAKLREQVEADRAAMSPAEREASDMMLNLLLYGQHPAPKDPPQFTGFAGLSGDAIPLEPVVTPIRDHPPAAWIEGDALWNAMLYGPPESAEPPLGSTATGLFDALGGITPSSADWPAGIEPGRWSTVRTDEIVLPDPGYVGRLQRSQVPAPSRVGHNPRIGCQRYDSGTWVHGGSTTARNGRAADGHVSPVRALP